MKLPAANLAQHTATLTGLLCGVLWLGACDDGPQPAADVTAEATADVAAVDAAPDTAAADTDASEDAPSTDTVPSSAIPTTGPELRAWLEAGNYTTWEAETGAHDGAGPHFGFVRTFINASLAASLGANAASHPAGAASVKELYGAGNTILGYAAMVKVDADSAGGAGWYWYEVYNGNVFAASTGNSSCTGCHSAGQDFFRSPFPLQ